MGPYRLRGICSPNPIARSGEGLFVFKLDNSVAVIWENIDYSEDRATYVFKATYENLDEQLTKIKEAIETNAQFRSALRKRLIGSDKKDLMTFKNYFGYSSVILKQRGKNKPFFNWESKVLKAFSKPTPVLPSEEEWERVKDKIFVKTQAHPPSLPYPGIIKIDIGKIPIDDTISSNPEVPEEIISQLKNLKETLYNVLK